MLDVGIYLGMFGLLVAYLKIAYEAEILRKRCHLLEEDIEDERSKDKPLPSSSTQQEPTDQDGEIEEEKENVNDTFKKTNDKEDIDVTNKENIAEILSSGEEDTFCTDEPEEHSYDDSDVSTDSVYEDLNSDEELPSTSASRSKIILAHMERKHQIQQHDINSSSDEYEDRYEPILSDITELTESDSEDEILKSMLREEKGKEFLEKVRSLSEPIDVYRWSDCELSEEDSSTRSQICPELPHVLQSPTNELNEYHINSSSNQNRDKNSNEVIKLTETKNDLDKKFDSLALKCESTGNLEEKNNGLNIMGDNFYKTEETVQEEKIVPEIKIPQIPRSILSKQSRYTSFILETPVKNKIVRFESADPNEFENDDCTISEDDWSNSSISSFDRLKMKILDTDEAPIACIDSDLDFDDNEGSYSPLNESQQAVDEDEFHQEIIVDGKKDGNGSNDFKVNGNIETNEIINNDTILTDIITSNAYEANNSESFNFSDKNSPGTVTEVFDNNDKVVSPSSSEEFLLEEYEEEIRFKYSIVSESNTDEKEDNKITEENLLQEPVSSNFIIESFDMDEEEPFKRRDLHTSSNQLPATKAFDNEKQYTEIEEQEKEYVTSLPPSPVNNAVYEGEENIRVPAAPDSSNEIKEQRAEKNTINSPLQSSFCVNDERKVPESLSSSCYANKQNQSEICNLPSLRSSSHSSADSLKQVDKDFLRIRETEKVEISMEKPRMENKEIKETKDQKLEKIALPVIRSKPLYGPIQTIVPSYFYKNRTSEVETEPADVYQVNNLRQNLKDELRNEPEGQFGAQILHSSTAHNKNVEEMAHYSANTSSELFETEISYIKAEKDEKPFETNIDEVLSIPTETNIDSAIEEKYERDNITNGCIKHESNSNKSYNSPFLLNESDSISFNKSDSNVDLASEPFETDIDAVLELDNLLNSIDVPDLVQTTNVTKSESEDDEVYVRRTKLIALGSSNAGKTSLLNALRSVSIESDVSTFGIDIRHQYLDEINELWTYDFGGCEIFQFLQQIFLSEYSICLLVVDISKSPSSLPFKVPEFWFETICHRLKNTVVIVAATHTDLCSLDTIQTRVNLIKDRLTTIERTFTEHLEFIKRTLLAENTFKEVNRIQLKKINDILNRGPILDEVIPLSLKTFDGLDNLKRHLTFTLKRFRPICKPSHFEEWLLNNPIPWINKEDLYRQAARFRIKKSELDNVLENLRNSGAILNYVDESSNFIFTNPNLLLTVFSLVNLSTTILTERQLKSIWKEYHGIRDDIVWIEILNLLKKLDICYELFSKNEREFCFPSLHSDYPPNSSLVVWPIVQVDADWTEYSMLLEFPSTNAPPCGLIERINVRLQYFLDHRIDWRNGFVAFANSGKDVSKVCSYTRRHQCRSAIRFAVRLRKDRRQMAHHLFQVYADVADKLIESFYPGVIFIWLMECSHCLNKTRDRPIIPTVFKTDKYLMPKTDNVECSGRIISSSDAFPPEFNGPHSGFLSENARSSLISYHSNLIRSISSLNLINYLLKNAAITLKDAKNILKQNYEPDRNELLLSHIFQRGEPLFSYLIDHLRQSKRTENLAKSIECCINDLESRSKQLIEMKRIDQRRNFSLPRLKSNNYEQAFSNRSLGLSHYIHTIPDVVPNQDNYIKMAEGRYKKNYKDGFICATHSDRRRTHSAPSNTVKNNHLLNFDKTEKQMFHC